MAALQEQLDNGMVLDGELVICVDGRLDFAALQGAAFVVLGGPRPGPRHAWLSSTSSRWGAMTSADPPTGSGGSWSRTCSLTRSRHWPWYR